MTLEEAKKIRFCNGRGYSTIEFIQALQLTEEIKNNNTMTQENKQLLLKDLCARLPYGVVCRYNAIVPLLGEVLNYGPLQEIRRKGEYFTVNGADCLYDDIKPYLRPMSSMTEKERKELSQISEEYLDDWSTADSNLVKWKLDAKVSSMRATFYNSYYLDWNDLISKGLALEAPANMYKTE